MKIIDKKAPLKISLKKNLKDNKNSGQQKIYRDKIDHLICKSKKKLYTVFFQKVAQEMKKTWKQVNSIKHK